VDLAKTPRDHAALQTIRLPRPPLAGFRRAPDRNRNFCLSLRPGAGAGKHCEPDIRLSCLSPVNLLQTDVALREALGRENAEWAEEELTELGALLGRPKQFNSDLKQTRTRLCSAPSTAMATGWTKSIFIRHGTNLCQSR